MDTRTWGHLCYAVHPLNDPLNDEVERDIVEGRRLDESSQDPLKNQ